MDAPQPPAPPIALCLGGMDPSGGAGLIRDVLATSALGCQPMAVSLAETLQNGLACARIEPPRLDPVACLESLAPHLVGRWGVKIGLCALDGSAFRRLAATLRQLAPPIRIWDPILAPTSGVGLHDGRDLAGMAQALLPMGGWIVSPNRGEASAFTGLAPEAIATAGSRELAQPWLEAGAAAVWLKGGHAQGDEIQDAWITREGTDLLERVPRLSGPRRGTGCFLAATWLALRLQGASDREAATAAAQRLRRHWPRAWTPGGVGRPLFAPEAP